MVPADAAGHAGSVGSVGPDQAEEKAHKEWTNKDLSAVFEGISSQHSVFAFLWLLPEATHIPSCAIKIGLSHPAQLKSKPFFSKSILLEHLYN